MHTATTQVATEVQTPPGTERESVAPAGPETAVSQTRAHTRIQALCALCGDDISKLHELYQYSDESNFPDDAVYGIEVVFKEALQRMVRDPEKLNATLHANRFFVDFLRRLERGPLNRDNCITELILEACSHEDVMGYFWTMYRRDEISWDNVRPFMRVYLERACGEDEEKLKSVEQKFRGSRRMYFVSEYGAELRKRSQLARLDTIRGDFDQLVQFGASFEDRRYEFEIKEELGAAIEELVQPFIEQCGDYVHLLVALYNLIPVVEGKSKVKKALRAASQPILEEKKNDFDSLVELYHSLPSECRDDTEKAIENTFPSIVERAFDGDINELSVVFEKLAKLHYELTNKLKETVRDTCKKDPNNLIKLARSPLAKIFLKTLVFNFDDLLEAPEAPNIDVVNNLLCLLPADKSKRDLFHEVLARRLKDMMQQFTADRAGNSDELFDLYLGMTPEHRKDYPEAEEAVRQAASFPCDLAALVNLSAAIDTEVAKQPTAANIDDFFYLIRPSSLYEQIPDALKKKMGSRLLETEKRRIDFLVDRCSDLENLEKLAHDLSMKLGEPDSSFRRLVDENFRFKAKKMLTAAIQESMHDFAALEKVISSCRYDLKNEMQAVLTELLSALIAQCAGGFEKLKRLHSALPIELQPLMVQYIRFEQVA